MITGLFRGTSESIVFPNIISGISFKDPDAASYIALVESTGVSPDAVQRNAIDTFYKTAKSEGYYASLKRLYLPIWANAAANAIDLITLASGSFVGGVTHAAGYVQGDGSTGYFDTLASPSMQGLTLTSASAFALVKQPTAIPGERVLIGSFNATTSIFDIAQQDIDFQFSAFSTSEAGRVFHAVTKANQTGVLLASRDSGSRSTYQRKLSSFATLGSDIGPDAGTVPNSNAFIMASGAATAHNDSQLGCYGFALGLNATQAENFSLTLQNLWETSTGLTLPS